MLAALENTLHQLADVRIDKRLTPTNTHNRSPGFIDGCETFRDGEFLLDGALILANPAAAGACQIACVQRLQHQYQRVARRALDLLLDHVTRHVRRQAEWESHD